ncbi:MAG: NADP-specific glutamate dehydrogenase [Candidatus Thermoplasmatota archaeon]|nr:NADP-specific glutamate dehydrogenase [Euryarchaeota archaeon]MBU4031486.1 NADP-specific glutamate dehydrogenase [Candidatus Thermoplasmatota archaeon]MBU4143734.1 NADP-specific glutamate dehydrogenase [Candidatus Thermoplasmatota archaeon]MBU4592417.1 NADP-specific glutamate dehydrogenase [Candidatus Thermoplasmatota archaeon]
MVIEQVIEKVKNRDPDQKEFHQAVWEVLESIEPVLKKNPQYMKAKILERIVEPERQIMFRVPWTDDKGEVQVNRGFRVQFNSAIGPYKGGLRFHPSVNLSTMKFLGFEQTFKNSLTGLPMGGGKGGSDFNATGKSESEVMRFCQSFMMELYRHIGPDTDVPAGDIGVGGREIGYLFGMYKKLQNEFTGVLTGKGRNWGGSLIRPEATGFGVVYYTQEMLRTDNLDIKGKTIAISGFGNVAWGVAKKCEMLGAKVVTLSGPDGYIYDENGVTGAKVDYMLQIRASGNDCIKDYADKYDVPFFPGERPWSVKCDIAIPCAIQNELGLDDAKKIIDNGCKYVTEAANMPCTAEAVEYLLKNGAMVAPAKAANAGGVATSGLEMSQNSMRLSWNAEEVDTRLHQIMVNIYKNCYDSAEKYGHKGNLIVGANIAGFVKVADAMLEQGIV